MCVIIYCFSIDFEVINIIVILNITLSTMGIMLKLLVWYDYMVQW